MNDAAVAKTASSGAQVILLTLAAGQFLMTLDSAVMNVSIATVAEDVGTTVRAPCCCSTCCVPPERRQSCS